MKTNIFIFYLCIISYYILLIYIVHICFVLAWIFWFYISVVTGRIRWKKYRIRQPKINGSGSSPLLFASYFIYMCNKVSFDWHLSLAVLSFFKLLNFFKQYLCVDKFAFLHRILSTYVQEDFLSIDIWY